MDSGEEGEHTELGRTSSDRDCSNQQNHNRPAEQNPA